MLKKLPVTKEPKLHVHKYVVAIHCRVINKKKKTSYVHTKWHYCFNLKEVNAKAKASKKGSWIEVFSATHNFIQSYAQE